MITYGIQQKGGQPFPESGMLFKNRDLSFERLKETLRIEGGLESTAEVYAYVLSSVSFAEKESHFVQIGSAPNFQGDHVTLCTCKHYMRSSRAVGCWQSVWIAGFTSRREGQNYLFYLMQVERAFASFRELWDADILSQTTKQAKNASKNPLGDLFRPLNKTNDFSIDSYEEPMDGHSHRSERNPAAWRNDINYQSRSGKHAPLLVGNPRLSFLWTQPLIYCSKTLSRGHRRYADLQQFLTGLLKAPNRSTK